jgi:hypothetical protein
MLPFHNFLVFPVPSKAFILKGTVIPVQALLIPDFKTIGT